MFTGIISGLGRITQARALGADDSHGKQLTIDAPRGYLDDVQLGDSIAINGACMTVTAIDAAADRFTIDISAESLAKTAGLGEPGPVNLEKAMRANDRLGGHMVSGHVDSSGRVESARKQAGTLALRVTAPDDVAPYLFKKGSIAIDGVSLTVNKVEGASFEVLLIPHTLEVTLLGELRAGSRVNLEADMIAKQVARFVERIHAR